MRITACDVNNVQSADLKLHRPNGRSDYLFVMFKSPAKVMVNGEYVSVGNGEIILFDKHKIQSYYADGVEFLHDYMHFDFEDDFEQLIFSTILTDTLITPSDPAHVSDTLAQIKRVFRGAPSKYRAQILTNLGMAFLYIIKSESEKVRTTSTRYFEELNALRINIYKNPSEDWTVERMSRELNLSRSYFQSLYKEMFEISCTEDVINARVTNAKMLLSSTLHPIGEIAVECGYKNTEHFIRQFKDRVGVPPQKFRNT